MAEMWEAYYSDSDIKRIQKIEIESLMVFIDVCKKLDIEFFLYGGSLLGAINYSGFVPWDDDLDVALLRKDYERLLEEGNNLLPPDYEIQHPSINNKTPYFYAKLRDKRTKMVEYENHRIDMNHGIYLDIYPIDNLPDDEEELKRLHKKYNKLVKLFVLRQNHYLSRPIKSTKDRVKAVIKYAISLTLHIIPHSWWVSKINNISTKYNSFETKRKGNYSFPRPLNYFDGIEPLIDAKFEGLDLKLPRGYQVNLTNRYGDISTLPPENERIGHRPYILEFGSEQ